MKNTKTTRKQLPVVHCCCKIKTHPFATVSPLNTSMSGEDDGYGELERQRIATNQVDSDTGQVVMAIFAEAGRQ